MTLKCTWCMKYTETKPCSHCGSDLVFDPREPHRADWSRVTMFEIECKQCGRVGPYSFMFNPDEQWCNNLTEGTTI